jgi:diguanylate cyclase (GGDEF)-like protein/PAS domain S-box-containing protein
MNLAAALTYWVIVALWLAVLCTLCVAYARNPKTFGAMRLLLAVLLIDTARNLAENLYFGIYWGGQYGVFPVSVTAALGNPLYLMSMKVMTVVAALVVLVVLSLRWLPMAMREWSDAEAEIRNKDRALTQESEERRRLFETSIDLILITDRRGIYLRVSPSSAATLGYEPDAMVGRSGAEFIHPDDLDAVREEMRHARKGRQIRNFDCRYIHSDGHAVPMTWSGVWSDPEQRHYFIGRDMTEQRAVEEKLRELAHFDMLTGLGNRTSLHEDLGQLLGDAESRPTAIAMFDLDGFKDINDTLSHSVGDALLKEVAERMVATAGDAAAVYRLGGDEFVLVLPGCGDPIAVSATVRRLLARLAERFSVEGHQLLVSASAGIAVAPADGATVDELVSSADLALYDAKAAGGRTSRLFIPQLRVRAEARRELDTELRRACAQGEFELHYQPQIRTADDAVVSAEALLRWQHPDRGTLSPGVFIEALAENAVAPDVGRWILRTACKTAAGWRDADGNGPNIAVNLFPAQFRSGTLVKDVEEALAESGLPPEALELEITENIALDHDDSVLAPLVQLRAMGVSIAFDDFGTGYASLSYLTRYPLTRIKIDRGFVRKIGESPASEDTAIVRSIIAMASNLGLAVTAKGVETLAQSAFLRAEGCHDLQGYLFSRPLPAAEFDAFLARWRTPATVGRQAATSMA